MILNDQQIVALCYDETAPAMIDPFIPTNIRVADQPDSEGEASPVISYGLTSFGYDMRLGNKFKSPQSNSTLTLDPKNASAMKWWSFTTSEAFALFPGHFVLAETVEHWHVPDDVIGIVLGKSTYARCGIIINVTPLEPGWKGVLTLEIHNAGHVPVKLYPGEGIAQINFHRGEFPLVNYASRSGKYQGQEGVLEAKV